MTLCAGIDVGSSAIKTVVLQDGHEGHELLGKAVVRLHGSDLNEVIQSSVQRALGLAGLTQDDMDYIATTGDADEVTFRTGHFYTMTTHARGALFMNPRAQTALDMGALHGRVIRMDERGKVLGYRMTSQCASGSGQFLTNIARYLGVTREEVGKLSMESKDPETCSSICAVLAETDVINMVSRGIEVPDILKGIHLSMAGRYLKLLRGAKAESVVHLTGGLAADIGLVAALEELAAEQEIGMEFHTHPDSVYAGAIGAAIWGAWRHNKLNTGVQQEAIS